MTRWADRLETERLVLRGRTPEDASVLRRMWTERDPRVPARRRIDADGRPSVEELARQLRSEATHDGLVVLADAQGRGYATEAAREVVAHARATGLRRLRADVWGWNRPSLRVLAKLGFVEHSRAEVEGRGPNLTLVLDLAAPQVDRLADPAG